MKQRRVLMGITGGIAAYKSAALVSSLVQSGVEVRVVMSRAATRFVGEATFAALTGRAVACDLFDPAFPLGAHIELAEWAELYCVAPATADFLGRMAVGLADDLPATVYLCSRSPVVVAPAMNDQMWAQPAVQRNVQQLRNDGVHFVDPQTGWLSCRQSGVGRMAEPPQIQQRIEEILSLET